MSLLRPIILCTIIALTVVTLYCVSPASTDYYLSKLRPMSTTWFSSASGYLHSATPYPNSQQYEPKRTAMKLVVLRNSQIDHDGFTLAVFNDRVAIDAKGAVSTLAQDAYDALLRLADETSQLPKTDVFRNQWRVKSPITGRPIERILSPRSTLAGMPAEDYEVEYVETSVYGFNKNSKNLEKETNGFVDLPDALWELTGLVLEAREGDGDEKDETVLQRVRSILGKVF